MRQQLNLIEHSDLYRRTRVEARDPADKKIVHLTRHFVAATTHFDGSYEATHWVNKQPIENIGKVLNELGLLLSGAANEIVLPLDDRLMVADTIKERMLKGTAFILQSDVYDKDYSDMPLDADVRTALDHGYRGMFKIADGLIHKWDRQMTERGQLSLAL